MQIPQWTEAPLQTEAPLLEPASFGLTDTPDTGGESGQGEWAGDENTGFDAPDVSEDTGFQAISAGQKDISTTMPENPNQKEEI